MVFAVCLAVLVLPGVPRAGSREASGVLAVLGASHRLEVYTRAVCVVVSEEVEAGRGQVEETVAAFVPGEHAVVVEAVVVLPEPVLPRLLPVCQCSAVFPLPRLFP